MSRNTPVSIGFLANLYGPPTISTGGGLIGTGVPLDLRKQDTVQAMSVAPIAIKGTATAQLKLLEKGHGRSSALSTSVARMINSAVNSPKMSNPAGVRADRYDGAAAHGPHAQPVERGALHGGILWRCIGAGRRRRGSDRSRQRWRRIDSNPRVLLRAGRAQANARTPRARGRQ